MNSRHGQAALEDEGAMSSQSDENITSLCLEAMNQEDDDDFADEDEELANAPSGDHADEEAPNEMREAGTEDAISAWMTDTEFSEIIHAASETVNPEQMLQDPPDDRIGCLGVDTVDGGALMSISGAMESVTRMASDMSIGDFCPSKAESADFMSLDILDVPDGIGRHSLDRFLNEQMSSPTQRDAQTAWADGMG